MTPEQFAQRINSYCAAVFRAVRDNPPATREDEQLAILAITHGERKATVEEYQEVIDRVESEREAARQSALSGVMPSDDILAAEIAELRKESPREAAETITQLAEALFAFQDAARGAERTQDLVPTWELIRGPLAALATFPAASGTRPLNLNDCEDCIVRALREHGPLTANPLSKKAGFPNNSNFRTTLSGFVKRGIIENTKGKGYHLP